MTFALGYVRVSTDKQARDGNGLGIQRQAVQAHARSNRLRLVTVLSDEGISGAIEHRPALTDLLRQVRPGAVVIVPRLDRLARDLLTQEVILRDIQARGGTVQSCSAAESGYLADDPTDPTRKLIRQVLGAVAEFERSLIRLRLSSGRMTKAAAGGFAYGAPPYGTQSVDGELRQRGEEVEALKMARSLREGGASLRQICLALTAAGHKPRRSTAWHPEVLRRMLAREA